MTVSSSKSIPEPNRNFSYNRDAVSIGIVHFGVGNFHRAHQAVYFDDLLEQGETQWGIAGVSLRSGAMKEALEPQDYLYTLATLGKTTKYRLIGALKKIYVAPESPAAIIDLIAAPSTQLISSTITEKGYYLGTNGVNFDHPHLTAERDSLTSPSTIFGFLAAGIIRRSQNRKSDLKLTIMCCDNISGGGGILKQGVRQLLQIHDPRALTWANSNVSFISSMVDRVSPATDDTLRQQVFKDTGRQEAWPVSAEPFTQWIIEDNFNGDRPNIDRVGAVFVADIEPFERMKLRYLNAAHTIASTLGYLAGDTYVHEAINQPDILKFMRQALETNILPNAAVPKGYDGQSYIEDVISRFQNQNLPYANLQVGTDSSQKIQQRWFPTIDLAIGNGADTSYFQFALAAWVLFIKTALADGVLNDPKKDAFEQIQTSDLDLEQCISLYLNIADAKQFLFFSDRNFMSGVTHYARHIETSGIRTSLADFLSAS